jgi:hypothetical protein
MDSVTHDLSHVLIELGLVVIGLAILARIASRWGFSAIPLYLLAGLAFGNGGLAPLKVTAGFIHIGAEIGVLLLLFMLGVEYTGGELVENLRGGFPAAFVDLVLNFTPGLIAGLLLGWRPLAAVLLGGVTYVSSSGVIAKVLGDLRRLENPETPAVLSILVLEDLAMAVYLPLVAVLLAGGGTATIALSVSLAMGTVILVLVVAVRFGRPLSRFVAHESDEIVLLTSPKCVTRSLEDQPFRLLKAGTAGHQYLWTRVQKSTSTPEGQHREDIDRPSGRPCGVIAETSERANSSVIRKPGVINDCGTRLAADFPGRVGSPEAGLGVIAVN